MIRSSRGVYDINTIYFYLTVRYLNKVVEIVWKRYDSIWKIISLSSCMHGRTQFDHFIILLSLKFRFFFSSLVIDHPFLNFCTGNVFCILGYFGMIFLIGLFSTKFEQNLFHAHILSANLRHSTMTTSNGTEFSVLSREF